VIVKDSLDEPHYSFILNSFAKNLQQNSVVYSIKIAFNICLENITPYGVVLRHFSLELVKSLDSIESSFSQSIGKRIMNKSLVKD